MSEWIETEIIPRVPKEWSRHVLEELGEFKNGVNFSASDFGKGFPVVNVKQLFNKRYIEFGGLEEIKPQTLSKPDSYKLIKGDILIARSSVKLEGTGQVAVIGDELEDIIVFSGFIIRYRSSSNKLNPFFLNYLLRSKFYKEHFINIAAGTSIVNLSQDTLKAIPVFLPSLPEQQAIAEVLSSLDDKIDLLHRNNKTLEEMAETLFRQWFVEGAKEDWEVKKISNISIISSGKSLNRSLFSENGLYSIMGANGEIGRTNEWLTDEKLLFTGRVGTLGKIFRLSGERAWLSDNTLIIKPQNEFYHYIYFFLKKSQLEDLDVGSTQPLVRQSDIQNLEILISSKEQLHKKFESFCSDCFKKIDHNNTTIRKLSITRDTLLPKLMSGQVRVQA